MDAEASLADVKVAVVDAAAALAVEEPTDHSDQLDLSNSRRDISN